MPPNTDNPTPDATTDRLRQMVDSLPHLVGIADDAGRVEFLNRAGRSFLGVGADDEVTTEQVFGADALDRYYAEIRPALLREGTWTGTIQARRADGVLATLEAVVTGGTGAGGEIQWLATLSIDVTEARQREQRLAHEASHDPLTGLPNRALLDEHLRIAVAVARRMAAPLAVLALDIDGFKDVNDRFGHSAGDRVLQNVAARLKAAVRPADVVARIGGDEFVVVIHPPETARTAVAVAQRIRAQLGGADYVVGQGSVDLSASIGLTVVEAADLAEPAMLLAEADRGMYRAKRAGGDRVAIVGGVVEDDEIGRLSQQLAAALRDGRISAIFDPVIDAHTGELLAFEVAPQWTHPVRGPLLGPSFMADASLTGYADLVRWAAMRRGAQLAIDFGVQVPVHMALSASQLRDPQVVEQFTSLRAASPGVRLCVQIDEPDLVEVPPEVHDRVDELCGGDDGLVLGRHGAGGVPLAVLAEMPLSAVKLDGSLAKDPAAHRPAVRLAVQLSSVRDVPCLATAVEDDASRDAVAGLGVKGVQGPVTGGMWDASRLAREAATPPRP
jgi:diguanylate cyclase (GGDEF)-like protein/PAS domain S-box-containing protein